MSAVKFLPTNKSRKLLTDVELNSKLASRARNRTNAWPLEVEERPVLIRTFAKPSDQRLSSPLAHDVDNSPVKGASIASSIQRVSSTTKRLREDDGVERASTQLK